MGKGKTNWLIYMQMHLYQNMEEMLITITIFVSAACHIVILVFVTTFSYYSFHISLPVASTLADLSLGYECSLSGGVT